jgi:hypothetical protein
VSIRLHRGYWTVFVGEHALMSFTTRERALAFFRGEKPPVIN